jgi:uncharacterized protein YycO
MVGDADDAIGHSQASAAREWAKNRLLDAIGRQYGFVCVVDVNNDSSYSCRASRYRVWRGHQVGMHVDDVKSLRPASVPERQEKTAPVGKQAGTANYERSAFRIGRL